MEKLYLNDFEQDYSKIIIDCIYCLSEKNGVVLVPTETVYGLACDWEDNEARERIYKIKGRDRDKPLQMLVPDLKSIENHGVSVFPALEKLVAEFCPGPITIIVETDDKSSKIGFRIPDHKLIIKLLRTYKRPLAATSANLSGELPALTIDEALAKFAEQPDLVIDAGRIPDDAKASTVVELKHDNTFKILREGPISEVQIGKVIE